MRFESADPATPPASELLAAMVAEISVMYDARLDAPDLPTATTADFSPPGGACVVGYLDGEAVCVGGVKRLDGAACEIKRMYVREDVRGRGIARELLAALEDAARSLGYAVARLDTGPKQPGAERMYREAGYAPIGNFNANRLASFWGEKALAGD